VNGAFARTHARHQWLGRRKNAHQRAPSTPPPVSREESRRKPEALLPQPSRHRDGQSAQMHVHCSSIPRDGLRPLRPATNATPKSVPRTAPEEPLGNLVHAHPAPRVAPHQSPESQHGASPGPVSAQGLQRIVRTGGLEPADRRHHRTQRQLISPDQRHQTTSNHGSVPKPCNRAAHLTNNLGKVCVENAATSGHHDVPAQDCTSAPSCLAQSPSRPIPHHGPRRQLFAHRKPPSRLLQPVGDSTHDKEGTVENGPLCIDSVELTALSQSAESVASHSSAAYTTVRRFRPFARRAFSTRRPPREDMRLKKPCTRFLGIVWGWYVRFVAIRHPPLGCAMRELSP